MREKYVIPMLLGFIVLFALLVMQGRYISGLEERLEIQEEIYTDRELEQGFEEYYTKEEIDEMLSDLALGVLMEEIKYLQLALDEGYTKDELDEGFEDVEQELIILEAIIAIIIWETDENYTYEDYRNIAIEQLLEKGE